MTLSTLWSSNFRNINDLELNFCPQLNLIWGANGAGKTNLLEAIYFLGRTRSFRTHKTDRLVRHGQAGCMVRGAVARNGGAPVMVSVRKDHEGIQIRSAERTLKSLAELAPWFPIQVIGPDSHLLLQGGPQIRRRFLDWGVFHVEQGFFPTWQRYTKALRQRNAALRKGVGAKQVSAWDVELVETAGKIEAYRKSYLGRLLQPLQEKVSNLLGVDDVKLEYRLGRSKDESLGDALEKSLQVDRERGFTRHGPHRADLVVSLDSLAVRDRISRGQQKLLVISLLLAQAQTYSAATQSPSLLLVDDLASELDAAHSKRVYGLLAKSDAQIFITALEPDSCLANAEIESRTFHVEHGHVSEMV